MKFRIMLVLVVVGMSSCLDVNAPSPRILSARLVSDGIELLNHSDRTLYTFVADPDTLAAIDWVPCNEPELCEGGIPARESRTTPFNSITGYSTQSVDVVVLHWHLVAAGEAFAVDTVRAMLIQLR